MSKKEKKLPDKLSEFHAIVPLPLEEIAERISQLADAQTQIGFDIYQTDDVMNFDLRRQHIFLKGRLQRWQGTDTRIDAHAASAVLGDSFRWLYEGVLSFSWRLVTFILACVFIGFFFVSMGTYLRDYSLANIIVALFLFGFSGVGAKAQAQNKDLQALESVLNDLAHCLTKDSSARLLEFDGTDDALARLLQARVKSIPIGADGEFNI